MQMIQCDLLLKRENENILRKYYISASSSEYQKYAFNFSVTIYEKIEMQARNNFFLRIEYSSTSIYYEIGHIDIVEFLCMNFI